MKTIIFLLLIFSYSSIFSCTTAIISGKFTKDGRPLLFKHRDTETFQNKIMFFKDGKYSYLGLVNSDDINGYSVWGGVNSEGFAIVNSASYNLMPTDADSIGVRGLQEGEVMKLALEECTTVEDFRNLLLNLKKPLGVEANFGVIDAKGGASFFETSSFSFTEIDVNNKKVAPFGYVIRTNFSAVTDRKDGFGYIRYNTANELFYKATMENNLSVKFLLQDVSRSLKHSLLEIDLKARNDFSERENKIINFQDYIPRYWSTATLVIEGVRPNESHELTTFWTILGFQLTSVAIPTWVKGGKDLPSLLVADNSGNAPLCKKALELKKNLFPLKYGNIERYINISKVINNEGNGYIQILQPLENNILSETCIQLNIWRKKNKILKDEVQKLYNKIEKEVSIFYKNKYGL